MRGSASGPSDSSEPASLRVRLTAARWPVALLAAAYLAGHLPSLAPSLEDIDSINFALGLREFDVAQHQPHPPGYPVYIALGRLSLAALHAAVPALSQVRAEALALAVWSAIGGAAALVAAWFFFRRLLEITAPDAASPGGAGLRPLWAAALLAVAPLFWMSGLRPMSDMTGLALALGSQACLLHGLRNRRALVAGALLAGLALGVRAQTLLLTLPLLMAALVAQRPAGIRWLFTRPMAALVLVVLTWAVPLVAASGGLSAYWRALDTQAGEDFAWVAMLLFNPTPRRVAFALYETSVLPWGLPLAAIPIFTLAVLGFARMLIRERTAAVLLLLAFAPYTLFHLLLQETFHTRYALPVVPAIVWPAACGMSLIVGLLHRATRGARVLPGLVAALPLVALAILAIPAGIAYGRDLHPAFRAIDDMSQEVAAGARPAGVFSHFALRRALQAAAPPGVRVVEPRRSYEWMDLVDYWLEGGRAPVWFLADPRRTDLALLDPRSRRQTAGRDGFREYRWSVIARPELGGVRPGGVDWYRFSEPPGWFAAEGWSLTPETGGLARATTMGVDHEPIDAYVRRRDGPMRVMVGAYHLVGAGAGTAVFDLSIDGTAIHQWTLDPAAGPNVLTFIDLPGGLPPGTGPFAHLSITARALVAGAPTPPVAIRQFDAQPATALVWGFGEGWHEAEYEPETGRRWRWTSRRSVIRFAQDTPARSVILRLRGESPLRYVDGPPLVRVVAAGRTLAELRPAADFTSRVVIPPDVIVAAAGAVAIETDRVYLPGAAEGTTDARELGLRLFEIAVEGG